MIDMSYHRKAVGFYKDKEGRVRPITSSGRGRHKWILPHSHSEAEEKRRTFFDPKTKIWMYRKKDGSAVPLWDESPEKWVEPKSSSSTIKQPTKSLRGNLPSRQRQYKERALRDEKKVKGLENEGYLLMYGTRDKNETLTRNKVISKKRKDLKLKVVRVLDGMDADGNFQWSYETYYKHR